MTLLRCGLVALWLTGLLGISGLAEAQSMKSAKRGLAYGQHTKPDMQALAVGVSWWYNWAPTPEAAVKEAYRALDMEFVPMVWGGTPVANDLVFALPYDVTTLLGFNEPNFKSQANMPPAVAAGLWPRLEQVARQRALKLASPAVNYCGDCVTENGTTYSDPVAYLDAFFAACPSCQVDYIAVHWYACDLSALQWYIGRFKKYGKPIWLTEFACGDLPREQITLAKQKAYMTAAVEYLENEPAVARYAWFSGRTNEIPNINLLGDYGELTELGQLYVRLPVGKGGVTATKTAGTAAPRLEFVGLPTGGQLQVRMVDMPLALAATTEHKVLIMDIVGRLCAQGVATSSQLGAGYTLPVSRPLAPGSYYIQVRSHKLFASRRVLLL